MKKLPERYILKIKPKEYLKQGISHCGAHSVKGILSAYGLDRFNHPKEYHPNWFGRLTGITLSTKYWPEVFKAYGIRAIPKYAYKLPVSKRLEVLKGLIADGNPVMISIGNGYLKSGNYNALLGKFIVQHFVTLWGYDNKKRVFYIYDSAVPKNRYNKKIPIGNVERTYNQVLRDWRGAFLSRVIRGIKPYYYIEIRR